MCWVKSRFLSSPPLRSILLLAIVYFVTYYCLKDPCRMHVVYSLSILDTVSFLVFPQPQLCFLGLVVLFTFNLV